MEGRPDGRLQKAVRITICNFLTVGYFYVLLRNWNGIYAGVAQLVEYKLPKLGVASSNLVARSSADGVFALVLYHHSCEGAVALKVGFARFFLCPFQRDRLEEDGPVVSDYIIEKVQDFAESFLPTMDLELVEVEYREENSGWVLRLFVDGPDGIGVDQCARVSREMNTFLEVEDLIQHAFTLEVSSPGLERPLRCEADFKRYKGRKARLKLRHPVEGQKVFIGLIGESDEKEVELIVEDGTTSRFLTENIRKARLSL